MATVNNPLLQGFSGKLGDQVVFRQQGGKTILCKPPTRNEKKEWSPEELQRQKKFRDSCAYAREAIRDPVLRSIYEGVVRKGTSAYNMAMADAQVSPTLAALNARRYRGIPGNTIDVRAEDNICVANVIFTIYAPDGSVVESGEAIPYQHSWRWRYTVIKVNSLLKGSIIRVVAEDLPGNQAVLEHEI